MCLAHVVLICDLAHVVLICDSLALGGWTSTPKGGLLFLGGEWSNLLFTGVNYCFITVLLLFIFKTVYF